MLIVVIQIANINLSADLQSSTVQDTGISAARGPQLDLLLQPTPTLTNPSYNTPPRRESVAMDVSCSFAAAEAAESSEQDRPLAPSPQPQSGAAAEWSTRPGQTEYARPEASSSAAMQPQNTAMQPQNTVQPRNTAGSPCRRGRATSGAMAKAMLLQAISNQIRQQPVPLPRSAENLAYTEALSAPPMQRSRPSVLPSMRASPSEVAPPSAAYEDGSLEHLAWGSRNGSAAAHGTSNGQPDHDYHRNALLWVPTVPSSISAQQSSSSTQQSSSSAQQDSSSTVQDSTSTVQQDAFTSQPMERQRQPSIVPSTHSHDAAAQPWAPGRRHSLDTPPYPLPPIPNFEHIPMSQPLPRRRSDGLFSHSELRMLPPWDMLARSVENHPGRSVSSPGPTLAPFNPITPAHLGRRAAPTGQMARPRRLNRKPGSSNLAASCSLQALSGAQAGSNPLTQACLRAQVGGSSTMAGSSTMEGPSTQAGSSTTASSSSQPGSSTQTARNWVYRPPVSRRQVRAAVQAAINPHNARVDDQVDAAVRTNRSFQWYLNSVADAQLAEAAQAGLSYREYLDADVDRVDWAARAAKAASELAASEQAASKQATSAQATSAQAAPADQAPSTAEALLAAETLLAAQAGPTASTTTDSTTTDSTITASTARAEQTAADQTATVQTALTDEEPAAGPSSPTYTPSSPTYTPSSPTVQSPPPRTSTPDTLELSPPPPPNNSPISSRGEVDGFDEDVDDGSWLAALILAAISRLGQTPPPTSAPLTPDMTWGCWHHVPQASFPNSMVFELWPPRSDEGSPEGPSEGPPPGL